MSTPRLLGGQLIPLAEQIRRHEVSDAKQLKELETENGQLKRLLIDALLENEVTKEAFRKSGECTRTTSWCTS